MKNALLHYFTGVVIGVAATLYVVAGNADVLYAWHWKTFVYKGDK